MTASLSSRQSAAQYVRMSTERQDFSIEMQVAANAAYAEAHGLEIVRTYTDAGISGLSIEKRDGLKTLLADVVAGAADFSVVLVFDVSRWGRFQNPDQAAHYEFLCSEAGVKVAYCAEAFENDGSPATALLKHFKRAMAAEFSRELSRKVSRSQRGLMAQGYWMGGQAVFGLSAQVHDSEGRPARRPEGDVWKKRQGVHTRLTLGPAAEVALVRRIFRLYLRPDETIASIARKLQREGLKNKAGGPWTANCVAHTLGNEIYTGRLVGGRYVRDIGTNLRHPIPPAEWLVVENAAPAIISRKTFEAVCRKRLRRRTPPTEAEVIEDLKRVASVHGNVSLKTLDRHGRWSPGLYQRRMGSITNIRALLGLPVEPRYAHLAEALRRAQAARRAKGGIYSDEELLETLRRALQKHGRLDHLIVLEDPETAIPHTYIRRFGSMLEAYARIGYKPGPDQLRALRAAAKRAVNSKALATRRDRPGRAAPV